MSQLSQKQLLDECKAVHKFILPYLSTLNSPITLKEKTEDFFQKLIQFLDDNKDSTDTEETYGKDSLHNNIPSTKRNLDFLRTKFTKNEPSEIETAMDQLLQKEIEESVKKPK